MKWAKYKIYILGLKMFQLLLLSALSSDTFTRNMTPQDSNVMASLCAAISMGSFLALSLKASAYVDQTKDRMELISKTVLVVTPVVGIAASIVQFEGSSMIYGALLNVTTTTGWFFMCLMWIMSTKCCQTRLKTRSGR